MRKLKDVAFLSQAQSAQWITTVLKTITPSHQNLQRILLYVTSTPPSSVPVINRANIMPAYGETAYQQWLDPNRLLIQLWESHSIRPNVMYCEYQEGTGRGRVGGFSPDRERDTRPGRMEIGRAHV